MPYNQRRKILFFFDGLVAPVGTNPEMKQKGQYKSEYGTFFGVSEVLEESMRKAVCSRMHTQTSLRPKLMAAHFSNFKQPLSTDHSRIFSSPSRKLFAASESLSRFYKNALRAHQFQKDQTFFTTPSSSKLSHDTFFVPLMISLFSDYVKRSGPALEKKVCPFLVALLQES